MVDPLVVDAMLSVLRRHDVAKFKCAEYQLELRAPVPVEITINPEDLQPESNPSDDLFDHLSFTPKFPDKAE